MPAAGGGTLPVFTVENPMRLASSGVPGGITTTAQVLGGGDKVALGGVIAWGATPLAGAPAGESLPTGVRWGTTPAALSTFSGSTAVSGARWGFRATGAAAGQIIAPSGSPGGTISAALAAATVLTVTTAFSDPAANVSVPSYIAIGTAFPYEVARVTLVCDTTGTGARFTVERGAAGTTAADIPDGTTWTPVNVYGAGAVYAPARLSFWTDQAAFACDGTVGGAGTVTIPGVTADRAYTLTFAGGLQTAVTGSSGVTPLVSASNVYSDPPGPGQASIVIADGRIASVTIHP